MHKNIKRIMKSLNQKTCSISLGLTAAFSEIQPLEDGFTTSLTCSYAEEENLMVLSVEGNKGSVLTMYPVVNNFPLLNCIVAFEEFTAKKKTDGFRFIKDIANFVSMGPDTRFFAAGMEFDITDLTEDVIYRWISKTASFSYDFGREMQRITNRKPKQITDDMVSELLRYYIVTDGINESGMPTEGGMLEKPDSWSIMLTYHVMNQEGDRKVDEIPNLLTLSKTTDEMSANILIDADTSIPIEEYQTRLSSIAQSKHMDRAEYVKEYITDEDGTYFRFTVYGNHHYASSEVTAFIRNMAEVAGNLAFGMK